MVVGLRVDLRVLACCSQWVSAVTSNHELSEVCLVVSHGLSLFGRQVAWWPMCIRGGGHDGCWHCAGCCCVAVACSWALGGGGREG